MSAPEPVAPLVEHFFRHEAGRLVSVLTRLFGWRHFDLVEDMVQATLMGALEAWRVRGVPDNPSGRVHRIARRRSGRGCPRTLSVPVPPRHLPGFPEGRP